MADPSFSLRRELDAHLPFQNASWLVERVAWVGLAGVIAAAVLGVFGEGMLSKAFAQGASGADLVQYERMQRRGATSELIVRPSTGDATVLTFDEAFRDAFKIERISPEPWRSGTSGAGVWLLLATEPDGLIRLEVRPRGTGARRVGVAVAGRGQADLDVFVFP